jgi:hypothetical protein
VKDGDDLQRRGRFAVNNEIGADWPKAHVAVSKIGPGVALSWPLGKLLKRIEKLVQRFVGSTHIICSDEVPDELQILERFRRKR